MSDLIDRTLGHYHILSKLGEGGMGEVYRAHDERLDRDVAVKVLHEAVAQDADRLSRFEREAKAVAKLAHPNILEIFDFDTDGDITYAVTELLEGETLQEKLQRSADPLPLKLVQSICVSVANGLGAAHGRGVIHRDVKPSNIFLCSDGRVKILDFGLARDVEVDAGDETRSPTISRYTDPGAVLGTVGYMSPEQVRGEPADHRSDIFALGCSLYEMLTGLRAFQGGSAAETMANILKEDPVPIASLRTDAAQELEDIVDRALQKQASVRYQQITDLLDDLEAARRRWEEPRITLGGWIKKRRIIVAWCSATLVLLSVSATLLILKEQRSQQIAVIISELMAVAETGDLDQVFRELSSRSLNLGEINNEAFKGSVAGTISIVSDPKLADVQLARVLSNPELSLGSMFDIGRTPIDEHLLIAGEYLVRLTTKGRSPVEFLVNIDPGRSIREVRNFGAAESARMTRVEAGVSKSGETVPTFLIDKREVTNEEYFRFVAGGGYRQPALWPDTLLIDSEPIPRDLALTKFVDPTGLNGSRYWLDGKYLDGKQEHPVVGISWYEARAYAQWVGKALPTMDQWWLAAVGARETVFPWGNDVKTTQLRANFGMRGTQIVGFYPLGISPSGCFDMAGNVREWVGSSESFDGQYAAVGGSWKEPPYMFGSSLTVSFDAGHRSDHVGFRCAKPVTGE